MYIPSYYKEERAEVLHRLMRSNSFGVLVTHGPSGLLATHLPFLLDADRGPKGTLISHLARANPQWKDVEAGAEVLVIFSGPDAYISPLWYREDPDVPTWNYAAVHVYGPWQPFDDLAAVRALLARTIATYEATVGSAWTMDGLPEEYLSGLQQRVVAFEVPIHRLQGVMKMSQNKPLGDVERVIAGLERTGRSGDREVAGLMREVAQPGSVLAPESVERK